MALSQTRPRILVVDDDLGSRTLTAIVLTEAGYSPTCVATVARALERLERSGADLVVTDLLMPGADGLDLLRAVQAGPDPPPVVAMTASDDQVLIETALELGAAAVLRKPITLARLDATVSALLRDHAPV